MKMHKDIRSMYGIQREHWIQIVSIDTTLCHESTMGFCSFNYDIKCEEKDKGMSTF